jgi:adenylate cyclase
MRMRLIYESESGREEYEITEPETKIGRGPDNQLVLTDYGISRTHCRIRWDGTTCRVEDMGSRNGTKINGEDIDRPQELQDGDEILLGRYPIRVEIDAVDTKSGGYVIDEKPMVEAPGTIIKPMTRVFDEKLRSITESAAVDLKELAEKPEVEEEDERGKILLILTQVAKALISAENLDEILRKVMDITFEYLPAERGFLMLWDDKEKRLVPRLIKYRDKSDEAAINISKTITEKAFHEQVGILTSDASVDPRFSGAESIIFHGIRSAMCVPLWNEGEVMGVVHVDSLMANNRFTPDDLDLMTALANYSAVAIQRARLHERIREEAEARAKLARYHSPGVVTKILASGSVDSDWNIEVQEREVSVLFADIVGFTSISEKLTPAQVAKFLNHYFGEMTSIIFRHEGTLDKFMGDALMAVFGAPIAQSDHAERAVRAAMEMLEAVGTLTFKEEVGKEINLRIRIGINSGNVVAGDIGSPQRMEYTVIGDIVNAASRIEEDVAKADELVIGGETWKPIKKKFKFEEIGKVSIRGKESVLRCFKVLAVNR